MYDCCNSDAIEKGLYEFIQNNTQGLKIIQENTHSYMKIQDCTVRFAWHEEPIFKESESQ